jgi:hypothetical protein
MTRTPFSILTEIAKRGQRLEVHGDRLRVIPGRDLPSDFVGALRAHKQELIALLKLSVQQREALFKAGRLSRLSDRTPLDQRSYILRDRDGDYVRRVISGDTETVKLHFEFTKDRALAEQFSYDDLWSPYANTSIGGEFTHGYGGGTAERIS